MDESTAFETIQFLYGKARILERQIPPLAWARIIEAVYQELRIYDCPNLFEQIKKGLMGTNGPSYRQCSIGFAKGLGMQTWVCSASLESCNSREDKEFLFEEIFLLEDRASGSARWALWVERRIEVGGKVIPVQAWVEELSDQRLEEVCALRGGFPWKSFLFDAMRACEKAIEESSGRLKTMRELKSSIDAMRKRVA